MKLFSSFVRYLDYLHLILRYIYCLFLVKCKERCTQDIFLILDEVPCNINSKKIIYLWGDTSGDWRNMQSIGVHLMVAFKPADDGKIRGLINMLIDTFLSRESIINLYFPKHLKNLKLNPYPTGKSRVRAVEVVRWHIGKGKSALAWLD